MKALLIENENGPRYLQRPAIRKVPNPPVCPLPPLRHSLLAKGDEGRFLWNAEIVILIVQLFVSMIAFLSPGKLMPKYPDEAESQTNDHCP